MPNKKTIEVTTYKFSELTGKAKDKAREKLSEWATDGGWWENVYEVWEEKLEEQGFLNPEINFSGFWCQGDGASFACKIDVEKWIKFNKLGNTYRHALQSAKNDEITAEIYRQGHSSHEGTMYLNWETYDISDDGESEFAAKVYHLILTDARSLAKEIYRDLEKEYYYLTDDEQLDDMAEANDYEFTEHGSMCVHI